MRYGNGRAALAFSVLELLVTVSILVLLATLVLVSIGKARGKARRTVCENNHRQLAVAWTLYSGDFQERLVSNVHLDLTEGWVSGSVTGSGGTNTLSLVDPERALFAAYVSTAETYRCPSDESTVTLNGEPFPRVRSVAMNQAMGYESYAIWLPSKALARPGQRAYRTYRFTTDIDAPSERFVFIGESAVTINDPAFAVEMPQPTGSPRWVDVPTTRHVGSGVLTFADGHVAAQRWRDRRTASDYFNKSADNNADWRWLAEKTSTVIPRPH